MKNKLILTTLTAAMLCVPLLARTWTSADGKSHFQGEYISSTENTVTVIKNGRKRTFKLSLISEADRTWIKKEASKTNNNGSIRGQRLSKKLKGKTVLFIGGKFLKHDTKKNPDYYFVYYSASW